MTEMGSISKKDETNRLINLLRKHFAGEELTSQEYVDLCGAGLTYGAPSQYITDKGMDLLEYAMLYL